MSPDGEAGPTRSATPVRRRGVVAWLDVRHRGLGMWASLLSRVTALGLLFYLYVHLAVLSSLVRGPGAWDGFLRLARTPPFLALDVLLIFGLLVHGLNGIRASLVGTGLMVSRQKALFASVGILGVIVLLYAALHIFGG